MKTFTIVYRRAGFVRNLRTIVQAYDYSDAHAQAPAGALVLRVAAGLV
jgi:hypothetical protein